MESSFNAGDLNTGRPKYGRTYFKARKNKERYRNKVRRYTRDSERQKTKCLVLDRQDDFYHNRSVLKKAPGHMVLAGSGVQVFFVPKIEKH